MSEIARIGNSADGYMLAARDDVLFNVENTCKKLNKYGYNDPQDQI